MGVRQLGKIGARQVNNSRSTGPAHALGGLIENTLTLSALFINTYRTVRTTLVMAVKNFVYFRASARTGMSIRKKKVSMALYNKCSGNHWFDYRRVESDFSLLLIYLFLFALIWTYSVYALRRLLKLRF